jgi:hypothetical protein
MSEKEVFIDTTGERRSTKIHVLRNLDGNLGTEGEVNLVKVSFNEALWSKTYVLKHPKVDQHFPGAHVDFRPATVFNKWKELKNAGVSVVQEMYLEEGGTELLETDLSDNGRNELLDLGVVFRLLNAPGLAGLKWDVIGLENYGFVKWFKDRRVEVIKQIVENIEKASEAGYEVNMDAWMCVWDSQNKRVTVFLKDLGQGVRKLDDKARGNAIRAYNVQFNVKKLVLDKGMLTAEEWKENFPQYVKHIPLNEKNKY